MTALRPNSNSVSWFVCEMMLWIYEGDFLLRMAGMKSAFAKNDFWPVSCQQAYFAYSAIDSRTSSGCYYFCTLFLSLKVIVELFCNPIGTRGVIKYIFGHILSLAELEPDVFIYPGNVPPASFFFELLRLDKVRGQDAPTPVGDAPAGDNNP